MIRKRIYIFFGVLFTLSITACAAMYLYEPDMWGSGVLGRVFGVTAIFGVIVPMIVATDVWAIATLLNLDAKPSRSDEVKSGHSVYCHETKQVIVISDEVSGEVVADLPCIKCGYCLRGLKLGFECPECGCGVNGSINELKRIVNMPDYLRFSRFALSAFCVAVLTVSLMLLSVVVAHTLNALANSDTGAIFIVGCSWVVGVVVLLISVACIGVFSACAALFRIKYERLLERVVRK
ncbi:hypothetical protein JD969_02020 [Planctomycetota bacterium]|nr:hypothetical protein JD969_02020 [Planctomycetota bacterium]